MEEKDIDEITADNFFIVTTAIEEMEGKSQGGNT